MVGVRLIFFLRLHCCACINSSLHTRRKFLLIALIASYQQLPSKRDRMKENPIKVVMIFSDCSLGRCMIFKNYPTKFTTMPEVVCISHSSIPFMPHSQPNEFQSENELWHYLKKCREHISICIHIPSMKVVGRDSHSSLICRVVSEVKSLVFFWPICIGNYHHQDV